MKTFVLDLVQSASSMKASKSRKPQRRTVVVVASDVTVAYVYLQLNPLTKGMQIETSKELAVGEIFFRN